MFDQQIIDHDSWAHGEAKVRTAGKIELGDVPGVLPFTGVRNPITTSSTSQKVLLRFKTEANGWQLKIGAAESLAEAAVAHEALCCPDIYDVEFQPLCFPYEFPLGGEAQSHDRPEGDVPLRDARVALRAQFREPRETFDSGRDRGNSTSLSKA